MGCRAEGGAFSFLEPLGFSLPRAHRDRPASCSQSRRAVTGGPRSHQEFLFQLRGAGRAALQGLPAERAPGRAQEVQRDLLGRAHGTDGLHSPQGPHVQHQGHAGAAPATETARLASQSRPSQHC